MLTIDMTERLGAGSTDEHPWLSHIEWRKVETKRYIVSLIWMIPQTCPLKKNPCYFPAEHDLTETQTVSKTK